MFLLIMVCWRAFGNTALGRPRSVEDLWGVRVSHPGRGGGVELIIVGKVKRFDAQEISHSMDEEVGNHSLPYLRELENKIGRKMPESLLVWMRDAAEWEDLGRSREGEGGELGSGLGDSFSEKISTLRQEMVNVPSGFYTSGDFVLWQSPVFLRLFGVGTTCTTRFRLCLF